MNNGQRQTMKLKQKLTPQQLLQATLLQLPITSLEQRIKEEREKNPMLDAESGTPQLESLPEVAVDDSKIDENPDSDDDDYSYRERQERDKNLSAFEPVFVSEVSFSDHLIDQLNSYGLNERQNTIAQEIIGSLDGAGYLTRSVVLLSNDLAVTQSIDVSPSEVEEVLAIVQQLDPPGIAARSLQECLSLQLHRIDDPDEAVRCAIEVVDHCFDDFSAHNYDKVIKLLSFTEQQLASAISLIRRLNPKPGTGDGEAERVYDIIPDFVVRCSDEGRLSLVLTDSRLAVPQLDLFYQEAMESLAAKSHLTPREQSDLDFMRTNSTNATMLIDALRQRHVTMLTIMRAVMQRQYRYFVTGDPADFQPLLQKDIAAATGYDDSTISRFVNSKYVQTDFGTFPVKDCFSQGFVNDEGEEFSTDSVRQILQDIVASEDKRNPLSDDDLSALMKEKGFDVRRRTVTKYRNILGIPVARLRRHLDMLVFLMLMSLTGLSFAQKPKQESYFDSILNARIREGQANARAQQGGKEQKGDAGKKGKKHPNASRVDGGALEMHDPEPSPTAIDTALAMGDELIDVMYNATLPPPSELWYGHNLSGSLVRLRNLSMDSLPDEITIQLLKGNEKFCFPTKNIRTSPYGWRWNRPHRGVDIRLATGDPVHAAFNGVVRIARPMGAYGNLVVVRHYNGLETVYGHLSQIKVKPMQVVLAGQVLGLGGSTGRSTGPHLHFEVRFQYEPFDPEWILDFSNYSLRTRRLYLDKSYFGIRKPRTGESLTYKADKSIVPEERPAASRPSKPVYATLKKGETLEELAKRNYTTADKIRALNPDVSKYKSGVRVRVR